MLSLIVFLPIIAGLLILAVPASQKQIIRIVSLVAALAQGVLAVRVPQGTWNVQQLQAVLAIYVVHERPPPWASSGT